MQVITFPATLQPAGASGKNGGIGEGPGAQNFDWAGHRVDDLYVGACAGLIPDADKPEQLASGLQRAGQVPHLVGGDTARRREDVIRRRQTKRACARYVPCPTICP